MSAAQFARAVDRLITQVAHWQTARWMTTRPAAVAASARGYADSLDIAGAPDADVPVSGAPDADVPVDRAGRVYCLVQRLADRCADAERQPRRPLPRLGELVLPDQLRVIADDLLAANVSPEVLRTAADDVDAVQRAL